jgi:hypothetical protein
MCEPKGRQKHLRGLFTRVPRPTLAAILLIPILLLIDTLCYQVAMPVTIDIQQGQGTLTVGSIHLSLGKVGQVLTLQFPPHNPLVHEYQIDGSDSTNNLDLDTGYLSQIADSFYYRLQAWMRDLDGTSRWRDLEIQANGHVQKSLSWPENGSTIVLPEASNIHISLQLQRPETPMSLNLLLSDRQTIQITLDRNDRKLTAINLDPYETIANAFFPVDAAPFAAMIVDTLVRILLWALSALLAIQLLEAALGLVRAKWNDLRWKMKNQPENFQRWKWKQSLTQSLHTDEPEASSLSLQPTSAEPDADLLPLFRALHPIALIVLGCSLVFVIWISVIEYQGQPHIYDDSAYLFAAKMYAGGHFWVPAPATSNLFPGPFMDILNGRWFAQYEPGTALTLVPGIWLGVPWLIEPTMGTLALLGIGLIAARLYNRRVATLAVLLGCLSPFYSYLAASYLSHAIALFYLVWGVWALLRFIQGGGGWSLPLSALCFGMATLTRDQVALLYISISIPGAIIVAWKRSTYKRSLLSLLGWSLSFLVVALIFAQFYLGFNLLLTGDPLLTPRNLFSPGDHWGFGIGVGFYGQHTLAAGLVNLDELLTSLQIDLFGWPFYLTLAFLALPFLLGRARKTDWFLLIALILTVGSYVGYFYHGIYLGPRYLFEDLPFLLILTARGILTLGAWGMEHRHTTFTWLKNRAGDHSLMPPPAISLVTLALVGVLILCNLIYYLPRQIVRYQNYTGLPDLYRLDTSQIYHPPFHHAIVITDNIIIYQQVLFPLNDPALKDDVIYAWGYTSSQFEQLRKAFPGRMLYMLVINLDGSVKYLEIRD